MICGDVACSTPSIIQHPLTIVPAAHNALAFTGFNFTFWLILASIFIVVGLSLLTAGKARRRA